MIPRTVRVTPRNNTHRSPRRAFTLVELLVVIAIIGILVSLILPAVQAVREAARRSQCSNNLMQIGLAIQHYEATFEVLPAGCINPDGPIESVAQGQHLGWMISILPYIEETNAYRLIDPVIGVYEMKNKPVRDLSLRLFQCPSDTDPGIAGIGVSNYAGCHHDQEAPIAEDNNGVFILNRNIGFEEITDGSSHTFFVGEKLLDDDDLGWVSGTRATLRNTGTPLNQTLVIRANNAARGLPNTLPGPSFVGGFSSNHPSGAMFVFGDGSVRMVHESINATIYARLAHRADGQLLDDLDSW